MMHRDEKRSLYSFLALYLISSFALLLVSAFWYYDAQKQMEKTLLFYKMQTLAEIINKDVINAHMHDQRFALPPREDDFRIGLYSKGFVLVHGKLSKDGIDFSESYKMVDEVATLVSTGANGHLGIHYTVLKSDALKVVLEALRIKVLIGVVVVAVIIAIIGYLLLRIFMRPIIQRRERQDRFIKDTAHELNTPITSLLMSTKRALDKKSFDEKLLQNISISTKQLYDLYTSLAYLSFGIKERDEKLNLADALQDSIDHYRELLEKKHISCECDINNFYFVINKTKASKLFGNLIGNAIKYSNPNSKVKITLKERSFQIEDSGIGIEPEKVKEIFKRYRRGTDYAGGFGVGLSIVADICREYGIEIEVESEIGRGTRFLLSFPDSPS